MSQRWAPCWTSGQTGWDTAAACLTRPSSDCAKSQTPVELCISSNVITESVPGFSGHHFGRMHKEGGCLLGLMPSA